MRLGRLLGAGVRAARSTHILPGEESSLGSILLLVVLPAALLSAALLYRNSGMPEPSPPAPLPALAKGEPIEALTGVPALDLAKLRLGRDLFHDPRLSGSGGQSCASCHDLSTNGALAGPRRTRLDTPTVFNAALNRHLGWEGDSPTLEDQAIATLEAPLIAGRVPLETRLARLRRDPGLSRRFRDIYAREPDREGIVDAIAAFERSLVTPSSRFDRWLGGDRAALSREEQKGYALFKRLGCVSCHQGRNIGGNLFQRHGIFRPLASPRPEVLRVPSLRNVATTAPYFHDGSAATLEEAVRQMARAQLNVGLTPEENRRIVAFLRTLTGKYEGKLVRAPE